MKHWVIYFVKSDSYTSIINDIHKSSIHSTLLGGGYLSIYLSLYRSIYLPISISISIYIYIYIYMYIYILYVHVVPKFVLSVKLSAVTALAIWMSKHKYSQNWFFSKSSFLLLDLTLLIYSFLQSFGEFRSLPLVWRHLK